MKTDVSSISLNYGDADISFFNIKLDFPKHTDAVWHRHNYYEIHVCRKGHLEYTLEGKNVSLRGGELLIIPPDLPHLSISLRRQTDTALCVISMDISMVRGDKKFFDVLKEALDKHSNMPLCIDHIRDLELDLFSSHFSYHTVKGVCKLKAVAAEFLSLLFDGLIDDDLNLYGKRETTILIDNMINLPDITLDDIARATNYSKRHTSRIIKEKYGVSLGKLKKQMNNGDILNGKPTH